MPSASSPDASIGPPGLARAPGADGVEVLEREADRIHHLVAAGADRVRPMLRHLLAHRARLLSFLGLLQRRHVGRRRRRRRAEDVVEDPLAAHDRRRPLGVRRDRQNAALPEQPFPRLVGDRHAAEVAAVDVGDPVVPRQPLVDERVVRPQQVEHVPVLAHDAVEEQLGLALERLPQVVVEVGKLVGVRQHAPHVAQLQPLAGEVADQRAATWGRPASGAPAARARPRSFSLPCRRHRPAARRRGCCSRGRTTGATPARDR